MYLLFIYESVQRMSHIFEALFSDNWLMRWELFSSGLFPKLIPFFFSERFFSISVRLCLLLLVTVSNYILF